MRFRDLPIGATFDFVGPSTNTFFDRCVKISARRYKSTRTLTVFQVGTVLCNVFNVRSQ